MMRSAEREGQGTMDVKLEKQEDGRYRVSEADEVIGNVWKDGKKWAWERPDGTGGNACATRNDALAAMREVPKESEAELLAPPADPKKLRNPDVKPDPAVMDLLAGTYNVKLPKATGSKVKTLREAILKQLEDTPKDDWIRCDTCLELATMDGDRCPFCGDLGNEPGADDKASPAASAEAESEEPTPESEEPTPDPDSPSDADESGSEVLDEEETRLVAARIDLDERIERITELKRDIAGKGWDLGREILAIFNDELWKVRGHASFKAFVEADLSISRVLAYDLMTAAEQFKREDFLAVGQSKIVMIAKLPPGQRKEALEGAKSGDLSYRDLRGRAKEANRGTAKGGAGGGKRDGEPEEEPEEQEELDLGDEEPEEGFTLLARVDDDPVTVSWRKEGTGRKVKANTRIALYENAESMPDFYAELSLPEADVGIRVALAFDDDGYPVGVTFQFVEA